MIVTFLHFILDLVSRFNFHTLNMFCLKGTEEETVMSLFETEIPEGEQDGDILCFEQSEFLNHNKKKTFEFFTRWHHKPRKLQRVDFPPSDKCAALTYGIIKVLRHHFVH